MTCKAIICDWNGTLFEDADEEAILRVLASDLARSYIPWNPLRALRLLRAKNKLETINARRGQYPATERIMEMFRIYNEGIIKGVSAALIQRIIQNYARRPDVQGKVVKSMLRPVVERRKAGLITGILSSGYKYGIETILQTAGYHDCFDFYEANILGVASGKATGFKLDIYTNKAEVFLKILKEKRLEADQAAYVGDSLYDAGCFELAGYPIVSSLTPKELKEKFARQYRAFIPKDEADLRRYLNSI